MKCKSIRLAGVTAIVCGSHPKAKRCKCGRASSFLCDWKVKTKKRSGTCDAPICEQCATSPAENKHLCEQHARQWDEMKKQQRGSK